MNTILSFDSRNTCYPSSKFCSYLLKGFTPVKKRFFFTDFACHVLFLSFFEFLILGLQRQLTTRVLFKLSDIFKSYNDANLSVS